MKKENNKKIFNGLKRNNYIVITLGLIMPLIVFFIYSYFFKDRAVDYSAIKNRDFINVNSEENDKITNSENSAIIHNIISNQIITSPLVIKGRARGTWFFEASFPIRLLDSNYKEIVATIATAKTDWMINDFVEFEAILTFAKQNSGNGFVVFEKDNPSGLKENEEKIYIPIRY